MFENPKTNKNLKRASFASESGQGLIEFIVLLAIFICILSLIISAFVKYPSFANNAVLLAIVGAFLGGIAWSGKQLLSAIVNHTQFHVLEILSSGRSLSRSEIKPLLNKKFFICRLIPGLEIDALQLLTQSDKIVVKDSKYTIATNIKSSSDNNSKRKS